MSKSKDSERDGMRLQHIYDAIGIMDTYLSNETEDSFVSDARLTSLAAYQLAIIGEAFSAMSEGFKERYPTLPYREAKSFWNFLIHEYIDVSFERVWDSYKKHIPRLKKEVEEIMRQET